MLSVRRSFGAGIEVEEIEEGLLVRQKDQAYVARGWRLADSVVTLIEKSVDCGLGCMIRDDHPRRNARWPNTRGTVYLAFSPSPAQQWSVAIDTFRAGRRDYGFAAFNGKYHEQFLRHGIPFVFEGRNKTAGHLIVIREQVIPTIEALVDFDHSVLTLNRSSHGGDGFTTEYVIQREIMENWDRLPFAERYDIVQDEFPVDGGLNSRRIDILARDRVTGDWLVIELKRAEAKIEAVHQVEDYLLALGRLDDFALGKLDGVLIAERIPHVVRKAASDASVTAYEIHWPLKLERV